MTRAPVLSAFHWRETTDPCLFSSDPAFRSPKQKVADVKLGAEQRPVLPSHVARSPKKAKP